MNKRYRKAAFLLSLPLIVNLVILFFLFKSGARDRFNGYFAGTITSAGLSILWLFQVKNKTASNILNFMKMMLKGYALKVIFLVSLLIGGYLLFHFDMFFFVIAFMFGTFAGMFVEIWYYIAMSKTGADKKHEQS